jgi:hypothetical protein
MADPYSGGEELPDERIKLLYGTGMANSEHLDILNKGVQAWNNWRQTEPHVRPDLCEVNLLGRKLAGCDLSHALLNFSNLREADLTSADLCGAYLHRSYLRLANLTSARLQDADVSGANLRGAQLDGADFTGVIAQSTVFADLDLSVVSGVESVIHNGPPTIGTDTLALSRGLIPKTFLQGSVSRVLSSRNQVQCLLRITETPARPAIPIPRSAIVPGSGTAFRPGAVICPVPEPATVSMKAGSGLPDGAMNMLATVAKPVAPLKIPVPPKIAQVFEMPKSSECVPVNVSAPSLNEAVKLFDTEDGTNSPEDNITNVTVPLF